MNIALLFLLFKRPDVTKKVFNVIRQAQPSRLYIAGDGARSNQLGETEKVIRARQIVLDGIDWPCEVKTLFRENNLGCRMAVSSAIDWFFEHEEEGIILEDDCLPDLTFFQFCEELLRHYRNDNRVMAISGDNFQQGKSMTKYSYYFSRYPHCWGWATWKRAWKYYDRTLSSWPTIKKEKILNCFLCGNELAIKYWTEIFDRFYAGKIDTWDYPWIYSCWLQNGLTILPNINLVSNLGFNADATHTLNIKHQHASCPKYSISLPLNHPFYVLRNAMADIFFEDALFRRKEGDRMGSIRSFLREKISTFLSTNQRENNSKKVAVPEIEKRRLKKISRYYRTETKLFRIPLLTNDTCTFLSDVRDIIEKEIYKFRSERNNTLILDCGSNIGISIIYFKNLYPDSKIIAFEPDPELFQILSRNIANFAFKDVQLNNSAVWINNFGVNFYSEGGHSGHITTSFSDDNPKKIIRASSIRLKSILDSVEFVDMLKMDIEGAEEVVLFDCGESLKKCDHIFIEYHSSQEMSQNLHGILDLFAKIGYRYHIIEAFARRHPFVDKNCIANMDLQLNLFFYKKKK